MAVEGITPGGKPSGPYDYLLYEENTEVTMDPAQLHLFVEGINAYLAGLGNLNLPAEYLNGINTVIDGQVAVAFGLDLDAGETVRQGSCENGGEGSGQNGSKIPGQNGSEISGDGSYICDDENDASDGNKVRTPNADQSSPIDDETSNSEISCGGKPPGMPQYLWDYCVEAGKKTGVDPYILAAQMEKESHFGASLLGSPSAGDGLMQIEPVTRGAYEAKFESVMGHPYDHTSAADQVAMAAVILADKGGSDTNMLQKYNGGDYWTVGARDSYGREIKAGEYAMWVLGRADFFRENAG